MSKPSKFSELLLFPKEFPPVIAGVLLIDENFLITGHANGFVVGWDITTGKHQILLTCSSPVRTISISPSKNVLVGCVSGLLLTFPLSNPQSYETVKQAENTTRSRVWRAASVDETGIVFTSTYGALGVMRKVNGEWVQTRVSSAHTDSMFGLGTQDGLLACGDYRGRISVWRNSGSGIEVIDYLNSNTSVEDIAWRRDNSFGTINANGHINMFEAAGGDAWRLVLETDIARSWGNCIHFTEDGGTIFGGTSTHIIQLDVDSQQAQLIDIGDTKALFSKGNTIFALTSVGLISFEKTSVQVSLDQVKYEYAKVSLVGRTNTGKTTLCSLIVTGSTEGIKSTFGKRIWNWTVKAGNDLPERRVVFHDHGGQETVLDTFLPFLTDSDIILLFFKKTDLESFEKASRLLGEIQSVVPKRTKIMMVETFIDHDVDEISEDEIRGLIKDGRIADCLRVCPVTGEGVDGFKGRISGEIPWGNARTVVQSTFVEALTQVIAELYSKNTTTMSFQELKQYYEQRHNPISTNHLTFLLENSSSQGLIEYYPKAGDTIIFNDEEYNRLRTNIPIYVEHKKGIVSIQDIQTKFRNDRYVKMLDTVYLSYGICYENGDLRIFPDKLKSEGLALPEPHRKALENPRFREEKPFAPQPVRVERIIEALSDLKLGCVDVSKNEGVFSWEQKAIVYFSIQEVGDIFSGKQLRVAYRIGGETEKTCERLSIDFPGVLESIYGLSILPEEPKKKR